MFILEKENHLDFRKPGRNELQQWMIECAFQAVDSKQDRSYHQLGVASWMIGSFVKVYLSIKRKWVLLLAMTDINKVKTISHWR